MENRLAFLKNKASKNFDKYMRALLSGAETYMLPKERLDDAEWLELNKLLAEHGVKFVPVRHQNGVMYMSFAKVEKTKSKDAKEDKNLRLNDLKNRASKNFDKYMQALLSGAETYMLPKERLNDAEWLELNKLLAEQGVKFVPVRHQNGVMYMSFAKIEKKKSFEQASAKIKVMQFNQIKNTYPNLSDKVVKEIVDRQDYLDYEDIYDLIRHTKTPYKQSEADFLKAVEYGKTPNKDINVFSYQHWTWSRTALKQQMNKPVNYHISLNVNIVPDLLRALDQVMAQDAGNCIAYYKLPKQGFYREVTNRHDPITIYLFDRNTRVEQAIVKAVAPYARSNEGLIGQMLGNGVDINKEIDVKLNKSVGQMASINIYNMLKNLQQGA